MEDTIMGTRSPMRISRGRRPEGSCYSGMQRGRPRPRLDTVPVQEQECVDENEKKNDDDDEEEDEDDIELWSTLPQLDQRRPSSAPVSTSPETVRRRLSRYVPAVDSTVLDDACLLAVAQASDAMEQLIFCPRDERRSKCPPLFDSIKHLSPEVYRIACHYWTWFHTRRHRVCDISTSPFQSGGSRSKPSITLLPCYSMHHIWMP